MHDVVSGALDTLVAALDGCGAMAGSDEGGLAWAADYDDATRTALSAGADLDNALYTVVCLLERTGLNHESGRRRLHARRCDAVAAGARARLGVPARVGAVRGGRLRFGAVRLVVGQHLVGYLWPNGHQDRLHHAAGAWDDAGRSLRSAAHAVDPSGAGSPSNETPEVYDAEVVLAGMQNHLHDLAGTFAGLAAPAAVWHTTSMSPTPTSRTRSSSSPPNRRASSSSAG